MRTITLLAIAVTAASCVGFAQDGPAVGSVPQSVETEFVGDPEDLRVEPWIEGLVAPWSLVFLPDRQALVTERPGRIRLIEDGELVEEPYLVLDVAAVGEGGLMGITIHPDFPEEPYVYIMYTHPSICLQLLS